MSIPQPEELNDPKLALDDRVIKRIDHAGSERRWRKVSVGQFAHAEVEVIDGVDEDALTSIWT